MACIARPRNTNSKMLSFYNIFATIGVKLGFSRGAKKEGEEKNKEQGFIVERPRKNDAFYRRVGKMAKIVTLFLEDNHAFLWVIGPQK